eukprot:7282349-Karenia_brevis.AAC.1
MKSVGRRVRHNHLQSYHDVRCKDVLLTAIARAVFYNDVGKAHFLISCQSMAKQHLMIKGGT